MESPLTASESASATLKDLASLIEDSRLIRSYAARNGKLPDEKLEKEFTRISTELSDHFSGHAKLTASALATLEAELLGLHNQLATAIAPASVESIRRSEAARHTTVFMPTASAVISAFLVFAIVVTLQGYWVVGKRLRDVVQRQDIKRQELVIKQAAIVDALTLLKQRLKQSPDAVNDCSSNEEFDDRKKNESPTKAKARIQQCTRYETLKEEEAKLRQSLLPITRELQDLQDQVEPATTVLTNWSQVMDWLVPGTKWDNDYRNEIDKLRDKQRTPKVPDSGSSESGSNAPLGRTSPSDSESRWTRLLLNSLIEEENRKVESRISELQQLRWRVLTHRFDILLEIFQNYFIPAFLGLLGALVFILRDIALRLRTWTYIPESWSNGAGRIVVGTMAGVIGGWFIPAPDGVARSIPPLVIPFLFGYSVNILFGWLDKAVAMMSSSEPQGTSKATP